MKRRLTAAFVAVVALVVTPALQSQQRQEPSAVFRAQVDATEVDVLVTDARGNLVTDLTAGDFELFEDGRPQRIVSFTLVDIPIERVERSLASPDVEPDIGTNEHGEGRVYIIAIDEIVEVQALRTRRFLRRFIEQEFAPNDVAAIVYMGRGQSRNTQDFTGNRRLLLAAADKVSGGFAYESVPSNAERSSLVRNRMKALRDLVEFAATLKGRRKALILLTSGLGLDVFEALDYTGGTKSIAFGDLHGAITAATRGNVAIYPIDPAGLTIGGDNLGEAEFVAFSGLEATIDLRALAEATGGFAVVNTNSIQESFARIVRDNSRYYVLGFSSTNDRRDGRFRRLDVRVKRPGLVVQARRGYLAPLGGRPQTAPLTTSEKQRIPPAIAESLASPVPNAAVPMRVFAASYQRGTQRAKVAIALEMNASALGFVEKDGKVVGDVAVAVAAVSADGKIHPGPRHEARVSFNADATERATARGVRVLTEMQLPPGRYQLRAAGGTPTRAGSVMYDLDVPDYTRTGLTMSGVALTADSARSGITIRPFDPLREELPGPITATREFQAGDRLSVYAEVYEALQNAAEHVIEMKVELRTDSGRVIATTREERSSKELAGTGGHGFLAQVPLEDAAPGLYVIHVEASANAGDRPTASRDILIRVL